MVSAVLRHGLIVAAYGLLALAVALVSPGVFPGLGREWGFGLGGLVFLAGMVAHDVLARIEQQAETADEIAALRGEVARGFRERRGLQEALARLSDNFETLSRHVETKAQEELDRVVSEVRVLQNLIQRLSTTAPAAGAGEEATRNREGTGAQAPAEQGADAANRDAGEILDLVREALRQDRVELHLQPIVGLPQRKIRFYECFSRVRTEEGAVIRPETYLEIAKQAGLVGAIDNMLLFRCVQLVRKAQSRRHNVGFFCNISGNTLEDRAFFSDFVDFLAANRELASNLIFEFRQEDIRDCGADIESYVERLGRLGFRFSLDRVGDLATLDFAALARRRFRYVKIEAAALLERREGARAAPGLVPADAGAEEGGMQSGTDGVNAVPAPGDETVVGIDVELLKRAMDVNGLELIVEKIESEQDLVELLDYRIDFGQGYLFGEPRLSREA